MFANTALPWCINTIDVVKRIAEATPFHLIFVWKAYYEVNSMCVLQPKIELPCYLSTLLDIVDICGHISDIEYQNGPVSSLSQYNMLDKIMVRTLDGNSEHIAHV